MASLDGLCRAGRDLVSNDVGGGGEGPQECNEDAPARRVSACHVDMTSGLTLNLCSCIFEYALLASTTRLRVYSFKCPQRVDNGRK